MKPTLTMTAASLAFLAAPPALAGEARFAWFSYGGQSHESSLAQPTARQFVNPVISGYAPDPSIGDVRNVPSFIGRKQAHAVTTTSTAMRFTPGHAGDRAGLVAMQSDDSYLFLGVQQVGGKRAVVLSARRNVKDPQGGIALASIPLADAAKGKPVYLKLSIDGGRLDAAYALRKDAWKPVAAKVDATFLSTKLAGGFVGTVIGLYNEAGK